MEFIAKSMEEAIATAAAKLGVSPDAVTISVLEETKGLFGKKNLRVRAEATTAPAAAPAATEAAAEDKPKKGGRGRGAKKEEAPVEAAAPEAVEEEAPAAVEEKPKGRGGRGKKEAAPVAAAPAGSADTAVDAGSDEPVATQADADRILALAGEVVSSSGLEVDLSVSGFQGKYVSLQIQGKDASHMVGKSGEVLNQLQYLLNVILTHQIKNGIRITLDADDFRTKREEQLTRYATKIAEQVQDRGEEAVLEALPAFERRVIHKALADLGTVKTYSEGEEPNRRVVIAPLD